MINKKILRRKYRINSQLFRYLKRALLQILTPIRWGDANREGWQFILVGFTRSKDDSTY